MVKRLPKYLKQKVKHCTNRKNVPRKLKIFPRSFQLDIKDEDIPNYPYITFQKVRRSYNYLHGRRKALNGYLPKRLPKFTTEFKVPALEEFAPLLEEQARQFQPQWHLFVS